MSSVFFVAKKRERENRISSKQFQPVILKCRKAFTLVLSPFLCGIFRSRWKVICLTTIHSGTSFSCSKTFSNDSLLDKVNGRPVIADLMQLQIVSCLHELHWTAQRYGRERWFRLRRTAKIMIVFVVGNALYGLINSSMENCQSDRPRMIWDSNEAATHLSYMSPSQFVHHLQCKT